MNNILTKVKKTITRFSQFIYLTITNFNSNNLWESASSCSFGFVFSFIPITVIIMAVFVAIIRVNPDITNYIEEYAAKLNGFYEIQPVLDNIISMQKIKFFDIFLAAWVVWMARKLFLSIVYAMNRIFGSISKRKTLLNQFLIFISEFVLVFVIVIIILASFIMDKILSFKIFENILNLLPDFLTHSSINIISAVMYTMLFILALYVFRFISGTKPKLRICAFYALLNTIATFILSFFLNKFLVITNYNVIYGTISTLIVMMLKVYFFFVIFLYCAQMIYVSQFFTNLLIKEIYLLPDYSNQKIFTMIRRLMFINPFKLEKTSNVLSFEGGDIIYEPDNCAENVYYISQGFVSILSDSNTCLLNQGSFFGEADCILNRKRTATAKAATSCKIIEISKDDFFAMINTNSQAATKAMKSLKFDL